jgi:hypothetical protein
VAPREQHLVGGSHINTICRCATILRSQVSPDPRPLSRTQQNHLRLLPSRVLLVRICQAQVGRACLREQTLELREGLGGADLFLRGKHGSSILTAPGCVEGARRQR